LFRSLHRRCHKNEKSAACHEAAKGKSVMRHKSHPSILSKQNMPQHSIGATAAGE